ncbi:hypothetical protein LCGC14_2287260, partial [marine sediment metagenome]
KKYGPFNWREKGVKHTVYLDAIKRHLLALYDGQWKDSKSGIPHLGHIIAGAAIITLTYTAKADSIASGQCGTVQWAVWQEASAGDRFVRKMSETSTSFDEAFIVTPKCTVAASGNNMKATVSFLTAAPAGTNLFHISWKAEIISTETQSNAGFDANIKIL